MYKARRSIDTLSRRARLLLGAWIALALAAPAAILAQQSSVRPAIYLPLVASTRATAPPPALPSVFGMGMTRIAPERGFEGVVASGARWIRSDNSLLWKEVEPIEGAGYRWNSPAIKLLEQEVLRANQQNLKVIVLVRGSPRWATKPYKVDCAPINPDKYARFAAFLAAAVERYSKPPYNVIYWQVGNEPDAYIASKDSHYGCWGVKNDQYYGGRAYGNMLKVVYPVMKAANPAIQVMHGSLLLDRPYNPKTGSGLSARFLEGVFVAGAADSFDILPYNHYFWGDDLGSPDWKATYLIDLQRTYNVPRKPMMMTEAGILCDPGCPLIQAYSMGRYYARAISFDLLATLWYIYDGDGFHNTGLIEPDDITQMRPAYYAYQHAAAQLTGVTYAGPLEGQPEGVEGYRFTRSDGALTVVVWANKERPVTVPVARGAAVACTAWDGEMLACVNSGGAVELTADLGPIYVVAR